MPLQRKRAYRKGVRTFRNDPTARYRKAVRNDRVHPHSYVYIRKDRRYPKWVRVGVSKRPLSRFGRVVGTMHPEARKSQVLLWAVKVRKAYALELDVCDHFGSGGEEWLHASIQAVRAYIEDRTGKEMQRADDLWGLGL